MIVITNNSKIGFTNQTRPTETLYFGLVYCAMSRTSCHEIPYKLNKKPPSLGLREHKVPLEDEQVPVELHLRCAQLLQSFLYPLENC